MICKVACCDDDRKQLEHIKKYFETLSIQTDLEFEVDYYTSPLILLQIYETTREPYDILLLDMEMDEMTGIELSQKIRKLQNREVLIIFLTSYPKYMHQSFQVQAFQYMIKPVSYTGFKDEIVTAYQYIKEDDNSILFVNTNNEQIVLRVRNIVCIEKDKGRAMLKITTTEEEVLAKGNLGLVEEQLNHQPFLKISRSCLVNMDHIYKFKGFEIELDTGVFVTMSRRKVTEIKDTFTRYAVVGGR